MPQSNPLPKIEALARERVEARIGQVTLDEAARLFGKPNRRAMLEFCRRHRIEVLEYSREDRWIRLSEIERVQRQCAVVLPKQSGGTRVGVEVKGRVLSAERSIEGTVPGPMGPIPLSVLRAPDKRKPKPTPHHP